MSDGTKVDSFPLSAVVPYEAQPRESDDAILLNNVVRDDSSTTSAISLVHEFGVRDALAAHHECVTAVNAELEGLLCMDVFRIVDRGSLTTKENALCGRIIRSFKNVGTRSERF